MNLFVTSGKVLRSTPMTRVLTRRDTIVDLVHIHVLQIRCHDPVEDLFRRVQRR